MVEPRGDVCLVCDANLTFEEVDVGVGTIRGNPRCDECGWQPEPVKNEDGGIDVTEWKKDEW